MQKTTGSNISTLIFLWLQNQVFYRTLQANVLESIPQTTADKVWADIGCSTGLITRLAQTKGYRVTGYDINVLSLFIAKVLSYFQNNLTYKHQDFFTITEKFDVISATSLLSVIDDESKALASLVSLLKDDDSVLVIIEPTEKMSLNNVYALIDGIKSWWFYKGLLLWAKAREGKHINRTLFDNLGGVKFSQKIYLDGMVCVTYLSKR